MPPPNSSLQYRGGTGRGPLEHPNTHTLVSLGIRCEVNAPEDGVGCSHEVVGEGETGSEGQVGTDKGEVGCGQAGAGTRHTGVRTVQLDPHTCGRTPGSLGPTAPGGDAVTVRVGATARKEGERGQAREKGEVAACTHLAHLPARRVRHDGDEAEHSLNKSNASARVSRGCENHDFTNK